jgi:SnoaL-like protein
MTDFNALAERYIRTWNETDAAARRAMVTELWGDDGRYIDPVVVASGHQEISATIGAVQAQFPDLTFQLAGPVDAHHDQARFGWHLGQPDEEPLVVGFDVVQIGPDGRLTQVLGFLDRVPEAAGAA